MSRAIPIEDRAYQMDGRAVARSVVPDSVVTRPGDNNTTSRSDPHGVEISTSQEWQSIGIKLSANTSTVSRVRLYDSNENLLNNFNKSLSAGDTFVLDDVNLNANENYLLTVDDDGNSFTTGFYDSASFPYTSNDGELEIVAGVWINNSTTHPFCIDEVGNVGFS